MPSKNVHLALIFKDFAVWLRDISCVGLNVAGFTTAKVLREHGVDVSVFPVRHNVDIVHALDKYNETHKERLTHVVISAPWLSVHDLKRLIENFKDIQFVILSHSNVGFLQADPGGVHLLRQYQHLAKTHSNLLVGGNSAVFVEWLRRAYGKDTIWLPNLYPIERNIVKPAWRGGTIKIGAFGAVRPEKNFMTAVAAAIVIGKELNAPIEIHMSAGGEGDQGRTAPAISQMCADIPGVTLIRHPWMFWDNFVKLVGSMDLLIQVSYTESFNMITADGIAAGVPSVVSPAITWAPDSWKAASDNALEVAMVGVRLLLNDDERAEGLKALKAHNRKSLKAWLGFLNLSTGFKKVLDLLW